MRTFLLCLACLTVLVLAQPAAAQDMSPARAAQVKLEPVPLPVFLASLKAGSPDGGVGTQNHCFPANWCQLAREECELECAPCSSATTCFHQLCEAVCYCFC